MVTQTSPNTTGEMLHALELKQQRTLKQCPQGNSAIIALGTRQSPFP